jgi:RNA polymerase sigma-70 factor (ECF subfamily)
MHPDPAHLSDAQGPSPRGAPRTPADHDGDDSCRTRGSLLARLRDKSDQRAWAEFVDRYTPMIRRWCRTWFPREADDMVQEVLAKLVRIIESFEYGAKPGRFRGWLKTVTRNLMAELKRGHPPLTFVGDSDARALVAREEARTDLERRLATEYDLQLLELARARVRGRVDPKTWAAYLETAEGVTPPAEAARKLGVSVGSVYQAKFNVIQLLKREIVRLEDSP